MYSVFFDNHLHLSSHNEFSNWTWSSVGVGTRVTLLSQCPHIGGVCSGGLEQTDVESCSEEVLGGLTLEFFQRNALKYKQVQLLAPWNLELHVAKEVFMEMLDEAGVLLLPFGQVVTATKDNASSIIKDIETTSGATWLFCKGFYRRFL
jgi:hypothetical protein